MEQNLNVNHEDDVNNFIYSLRHEGQEIIYLNDSRLKAKHGNLTPEKGWVVKTSEIARYIEEFAEKLSPDFYISSGKSLHRYVFPKCKSEDDLLKIKNKKFKTIEVSVKSLNEDNPKELSDSYEVVLSLYFNYPSSEIIKDIKKLVELEDFFSMDNIVEMFGIQDEEFMDVFLSSEKMVFLKSYVVEFMIMEYSLMRKNFGFSKDFTLDCIKKIYSFEL